MLFDAGVGPGSAVHRKGAAPRPGHEGGGANDDLLLAVKPGAMRSL
jgi:hypothetical protein